MTDAPRGALPSTAEPFAALRRISARSDCGVAHAEIAAGERFFARAAEGVLRAATAPGRGCEGPDHQRMRIAGPTPARRLAADGVARGDERSIPRLGISGRPGRSQPGDAAADPQRRRSPLAKRASV
jgi:hypothetical protein